MYTQLSNPTCLVLSTSKDISFPFFNQKSLLKSDVANKTFYPGSGKRLEGRGRGGGGLIHLDDLFFGVFMPHQRYFNYLTATVHKSMLAGLFLTRT